jgi:hypothetical protein
VHPVPGYPRADLPPVNHLVSVSIGTWELGCGLDRLDSTKFIQEYMIRETARSRIKRLIRARLPGLSARVMEPILLWRHLRYVRRLDPVTASVVQMFGLKVQAGPFEGLKYIDEAMHSGFMPKILGCYESEIVPAVEETIRGKYQTILNVGAAEGYYAVGLARALPDAVVFAFDTNETCRSLCARLADLNGVSSRVTIGGTCDHTALNQIAGDSVFLMCDCEGHEVDLLDPLEVPALARWDILVELHDCLRSGITPTIQSRFEKTHAIRLIDSVRRQPSDYPIVDFLKTRHDRRLAVDDLRAMPQQWAWMKSLRAAPTGAGVG